jgi:RNA polymerase sigma-70 factor (ECF subfamily)
VNEAADGTPLARTTFDRLVLEQLPAAQRFAIRLTGDPHAAEDIVQDALLRAHRAWTSFRSQSKFKTWLFQIIINCFRDHLASGSRPAYPLTQDVESQQATPVLNAQSHELGELIASEVSRLPPRQREVLVLITYEQHAIAAVATMLGLSEQNVRTNLSFARERLRQRLARYLEPSGYGHERRSE